MNDFCLMKDMIMISGSKSILAKEVHSMDEKATESGKPTYDSVSPNKAGVQTSADAEQQGRDDYFMDIDRMVNEGLGGGNVTINNGLIEESTTDTMDHPESVTDELL
jgi:hypothetical protein